MRTAVIGVVVVGAFVSVVPVVEAQGPTFDCAKADGTVEELICKDPVVTEELQCKVRP